MLHNEKDDLELIMETYKKLGFSVKIEGKFLVLEKQGKETEGISIEFAIEFMNSVEIANY